MKSLILAAAATAGLAAAAMSGGDARAQDVACPVKLGGILALTGSMGPVGKNIANSAQLAVEHINEGGGVKGCQVEFILRDDQGQPTVGVDAAKYLVDVERVPAITGTIASGVTMPILTSVAIPAGVPMVSCCSTAATFTTLAQEGKTNGLFFRTLPTVKTQAYASAKVAAERGYKKIAMVYVNSDFGTGMVKDFTRGDRQARRRGRRQGRLQREPALLPRRGEHGARLQPGRGVLRGLPAGRRHHDARVDLARRHAEPDPQQLAAQPRIREVGRRKVPSERVRHGQRLRRRADRRCLQAGVPGQIRHQQRRARASIPSTTPSWSWASP